MRLAGFDSKKIKYLFDKVFFSFYIKIFFFQSGIFEKKTNFGITNFTGPTKNILLYSLMQGFLIGGVYEEKKIKKPWFNECSIHFVWGTNCRIVILEISLL